MSATNTTGCRGLREKAWGLGIEAKPWRDNNPRETIIKSE
jgi:hypothetical protein